MMQHFGQTLRRDALVVETHSNHVVPNRFTAINGLEKRECNEIRDESYE